MSAEHDHSTPDLSVDNADQLMTALVDAREALGVLEHAFRSVACSGCDPTGERAAEAGIELMERYEVNLIDSDFLIAQAADTRQAMQQVLVVPTCEHHDHDDEGGDRHG